jgi:hypothetical protein
MKDREVEIFIEYYHSFQEFINAPKLSHFPAAYRAQMTKDYVESLKENLGKLVKQSEGMTIEEVNKKIKNNVITQKKRLMKEFGMKD